MCIKTGICDENEYETIESMENFTDDGIKMTELKFKTLDSRYCGKYVKSLTIGGVGTKPEYRRGGAVRQMLNKVFEMAPERDWVVSFLHPFSFSYYRKFGYEKVADHKIVEFPIEKLEFIPRCTDLVPVENEKTAIDCINVYNKFADNRNIMFRRFEPSAYLDKNGGSKTYVWYDKNGEPASYITLESEQYFEINRMVSVNLNVHEMAFTTKESLDALFGFVRMFEGEDKSVKIHNCAMSPEIDMTLRHYMHTQYRIVPDIQARILNVKGILELNDYPEDKGVFTIKVEDTLPYTRGAYRVEYQNRKAFAEKISDDTACDVEAEMPAFTQLVYGYDEYDPFRLSFMEGVKLNNPKSDFFKAFHKKNNGLFEHF